MIRTRLLIERIPTPGVNFKTRYKYVPVSSTAASLPPTVLKFTPGAGILVAALSFAEL